MANRFPPLFSTPMISAPQAAPIALPRAPDRLAPPMTQAAIARRPVHLAPAFLRRAGAAPRVDRSSADRAGGKFPAAEPSLEEAEGPGTYLLDTTQVVGSARENPHAASRARGAGSSVGAGAGRRSFSRARAVPPSRASPAARP
jgi:hypothetical protein